MRKIKFANNQYYHIYNRGVDKRKIFCCERDFVRFLVGMGEFNNGLTREQRNHPEVIAKLELSELGSEASEPSSESSNLVALVEIICYCLNLNHYHFILKQLAQDGISRFMHKLSTSYTNYFNKKYDRSGALFQGKFKAVHIDTNEYLLWLSGYVNGNAEIHKMAEAENYKWCSYPDYLGDRGGDLCNKEIILSQFENIKEYQEYVEMVIRESSTRKDLEKYFIE